MTRQIKMHNLRGEEWSMDEGILYELAWMETKLRESGMTKEANLAKKLRKVWE